MLKTICALAIGIKMSSAFAANVGVSINVGDPGYYGRLDIGNVPQPPQVIYSQPVYVQRASGGNEEPLYLRVPPGHEKHWNKHCQAYNACNRPVYFVRDDWYQQQYVARNRGEDRRDEEGRGRVDNQRGEPDRNRDDGRRGDRGRADDRGRGNDNH